MKIMAFGKAVTRERAVKIILRDFEVCICAANNTDVLEALLMHGWKGLEKWTNTELEEFISELCEENQ